MERDHSTTYHARSQRSGSFNRSQEEPLELEGEFEEQPPNFADISEIQDMNAELVNGSQSEMPALEGKTAKEAKGE